MIHEQLTPNEKLLKINSENKAPSGPACDEFRGGALETEINRQHGLCCTFKLSEVPHWVTKEQNEAIWFHAGTLALAGHPISMATCDISLHSKYIKSNEFLERRTGLQGLLILPMFNKWNNHDHYFIDQENTYVSVTKDRPYYASNVNIEALEIWEQVSMSSITELSHAMCKPRLSVVSA
jgi:hypothetical protein